VVFFPKKPTIGGGCLLSLGWLSVTVCTLVPSKAPFSDPAFHAELRSDHQTAADWSQFGCKAMLNCILICSLHFFNGGWQWVAELWKYRIDALAGKSVIAAGCV